MGSKLRRESIAVDDRDSERGSCSRLVNLVPGWPENGNRRHKFRLKTK